MGFVHLHVHSCFSFYDGTAGVEQLVARAAEQGMPALALTDYNGVYGAVRFIRAAKEKGIKPIIGAEVTVEGIGKLVLLARSLKGYGNLCRAISSAMMTDPQFPVIPLEVLSENSGGLFALLGKALENDEPHIVETADRKVSTCLDLFGRDGLLIELENYGLAGDAERMHRFREIAAKSGLLAVATNNVHLLEPGDYPVHHALVATARVVHHRKVMPRPNSECYLKSGTQMARAFIGYGEALFNADLIAQECALELSLGVPRPPAVNLPDETSAADTLRRLCYRALNQRFSGNRTSVARRLSEELRVIDAKGFSDYFLVVADLVRFARSKGIRNSCRGSAAGCLVAYLLEISAIDPVEYGLLFERFLNPERVDIPDIDIDFDSRRRDEVIAYAMERYPGHAAMVATVSRFRGRSAIREVGRAMGLDYEKLDELVRFFRYMPASKIRESLNALPELRDSELAGEKYQHLLDICSRIDKFPRHISVHLGGVVISKEPIANYSPVFRSRKGWPVLSFDKDDSEMLGLIKTDLLGLRMLSAIEEADSLLREREGTVRVDRPDRTDARAYELMRSADTLGCFQVESPGMRSLLGQLLPERFENIISAISIFRPGPVKADMVRPYIHRRLGRERVVYPHRILKPILDETYGVVLFQEQVLRIAHEVAGFTLGQGDLMRRAMKEATSEKMRRYREDFLQGAMTRGLTRPVAETIFEELSTLAAFGFNKAHASSFAHIVYQSALLKAYHPAQFMLGVLNNLPGMYPERVLLHEAARCGVEILGPDINRSVSGYALEQGSLRVGLRGVRHMGPANLSRILEEREQGFFCGARDFQERTRVHENLLNSLILSGCFDDLHPSRQGLLARSIREENSVLPEHREGDFSLSEKVRHELAHIGLDLSAHLMSLYRPYLSRLGVLTAGELRHARDGERVVAAGLKIMLHTPPTRSGIRVVFLTLEDETGVADLAVFPDAQEKHGRTVFGAEVLIVEGTVKRVADSISISADTVSDLNTVLGKTLQGGRVMAA